MLLRSYLQTQYALSRRKIIELINQEKIFINQKKVEAYNHSIQKGDRLDIPSLNIHKHHINLSFQAKKPDPLLLFNKPVGYVCSKSDPHNPTFYELLPKEFAKRYYYIGRLDKESHGLMLLTSDPQTVHTFEHPSKEISKIYHVKLDKPFDWKEKIKILKGIKEGDELLRTLAIRPLPNGIIEITLNEGKKRHIRRIFKALRYEVIDLKRVQIGPYTLGDLVEGSYRATIP